jgi:hypothetical protein
MKKSLIQLLLLCVILNSYAQTISHISYQKSDLTIPNPERGFYHQIETYTSDYVSLDKATLVAYRDNSIALILRMIYLDNFTNSDISSNILSKIDNDLTIARKAGVKVIIRIAYTTKTESPYGDAPLSVVLRHIQQLTPIFKDNVDVIAVVQAGFIGAWGEWYYTDYFSKSLGVVTTQNWTDRTTLIDALLQAVPSTRMVQVRTPSYKQILVGSTVALDSAEAYTNTPKARIAHHNDCFLASYNDVGTYSDTLTEKNYLQQDSKYSCLGGETCELSSFSECPNSMSEMKRMHWSFLNADYNGSVISNWNTDGCLVEIQKYLGYRYYLISADIHDSSRAGSGVALKLKLFNAGYSNPYNPRRVEIILKNTTSAEKYYLNTQIDPRFWNLNDTINLNISAGLGTDIPDGTYDVYLNLPDPQPLVYNNPNYSIQLANTGLWDAITGFNSLNHSLIINKNVNLSKFKGDLIFQSENKTILDQTTISASGNLSDWQNIDTLATDTNQYVRTLKAFNTNDSLFFFIGGNTIAGNNCIYLDADNNSSTGYNNPFWTVNGADYLIQNGQLYYFTGKSQEQSSWENLGEVSFVQTSEFLQIQAGITQFDQISLQKHIKFGFINNTVNGLPSTGNAMSDYYLFTVANPVKCSSYGNNILTYWGVNDSAYYQVLQRKEANGSFSDLAILQPGKIYYTDDSLIENKKYGYRIYLLNENQTNMASKSDSINAGLNSLYYTNIKLDGGISDWAGISPVASVMQNKIRTLRFVNTADSIYFTIEGADGNSFKLFIDADNNDSTGLKNVNLKNGGFDYCFSNDSLYEVVSGKYVFVKKINFILGASNIECGIALSDIPLINNLTQFRASAISVVKDSLICSLPAEYPALCEMYSLPSVPSNFKTINSTTYPYTRIVLSWTKSDNNTGYVIERTISNDSSNFSELVELGETILKYWDDNLDSSQTYYYRMFAFNTIARSDYTSIIGGKPGSISTATKDITSKSGVSIEVFPNPITNYSVVRLYVPTVETVLLNIYDSNGRLVRKLYSGKASGISDIEIDKTGISAGVYYIQLKSDSNLLVKKIVVL